MAQDPYLRSNLSLVGVAIAVHNRVERTRDCLTALRQSDYPRLLVCVVDDGSTDNTLTVLDTEFPWVHVIRGDGNLWWTGGTNLAVQHCLDKGCQYVLLLNPDCTVRSDTISSLMSYAQKWPNSVIAPIVVDERSPEFIWWAGTIWGPLPGVPFIWLLRRNKLRRGYHISRLPDKPYQTAETGGRGVLVSRTIFEKVGLFDQKQFPHYSADNDFGLRVHRAGFNILMVPDVIIRLYTGDSGNLPARRLRSIPSGFLRHLFSRRNGQKWICNWRLLKKHAPGYAVIPSFVMSVVLVTIRYWAYSIGAALSNRRQHE